MASVPTERDRAKADRQSALLREAARLFADRGFSGVSLEELGAAVGISGPAVYRHFAGKQALLGAILVRVSEGLRDGGLEVVEAGGDARERLAGLVRFHVDFALGQSDVIRVQDRELANLVEDDRRAVRRLQREYVETWVGGAGRGPPRVRRAGAARAGARLLRADQLDAAQRAGTARRPGRADRPRTARVDGARRDLLLARSGGPPVAWSRWDARRSPRDDVDAEASARSRPRPPPHRTAPPPTASSRRDFLKAGGLAAAGLLVGGAAGAAAGAAIGHAAGYQEAAPRTVPSPRGPSRGSTMSSC